MTLLSSYKLMEVTLGLPTVTEFTEEEASKFNFIELLYRQILTTCEVGLHQARMDIRRKPFELLKQIERLNTTPNQTFPFERNYKAPLPKKLHCIAVSSSSNPV